MKKIGVSPYKKLDNVKSSVEIKAPTISKTLLFSYLSNKEYDQFLQCVNQIYSSKVDDIENPLLLMKESLQKSINQLILVEKSKKTNKKTTSDNSNSDEDPSGSKYVNIVGPLIDKDHEIKNVYSAKVYVNSRRNVEQDEEIR